LGERIVVMRRLRGVTQKELARRLGVDPDTLIRGGKLWNAEHLGRDAESAVPYLAKEFSKISRCVLSK